MRALRSIFSQFTMRQPPLATTPQGGASLLIEMGREVAQGLFERIELDTFLQRAADNIERRFPEVEHVQIYVTRPDDQQATLRAATGPAGQRLLEREYELDIGGLSAVGRVTLTQRPLLIPDYHQEKIHKPLPLLSDMRTELAVPLVVQNRVIGALDVQGTRPNAFSHTTITLLYAIADQLTIAVDSLQLYEEAQRNIRENQALFEQTQANLREIERLNYQLTGRAWNEYLRLQSDSAAMTFDLDTHHVSPEAEWTDTLNEAATHRQVITTTNAGQRIVALPIIVRNEVIGAMEFELASDEALPEGILELAGAVGQRVGLAMENRRLFDETQRAVQREALINDIGADLQTATGVDAIIQRAARHLQDALDAHQVTIRLGTLDGSQRKAGP